MKKRFYKKIVAMLAVSMMLTSLLAGCGSKSDSSTNSSTDSATDSSSSQESQEASIPGDGQPMGKITPAIDVNVVNFTNSTVKYNDGEDVNNNVWVRAYADTLGINLKYQWVADETQFFQKMGLTIASGDLPDIFPVSAQQMNTLLATDKIADLSEIYNTYASPLTTSIVNQDPDFFNLGKREGKLYGIPYSNGGPSIDQPAMLYLRSDWLKKLNLPEPKTMDDFYKIAEAFVTQDPDGNGVDDTYALALTRTLQFGDSGTGMAGFAGLQGFANAYHAYLGTWVKDSSGKIVYGSIQPEVKTMLLALQKMYKDGMLDKEFTVKDSTKVAESTTSGKIGMEFGQMWNPFYPLNSTLGENKDAEWQAYAIPSIDENPVKVSVPLSAFDYWVVRKDFEHPEAAIKMLNLFTEKCWGETADNNMFNGDGSNYVPFKYATVQSWPAMKNLDAHNHVVAALQSKDASALNPEEKNYYDQITAYLESGDPSLGWGANKIFGENATFDVISQYKENDMYLYDQYNGSPTPTMVDKWSTLNQMELEAFTKIIMGEDISEFDTFVANWKSLGGDTITEEMNAAK